MTHRPNPALRKKRTPRPARPPTMVALQLAPEVELTERLAIEAFADGAATTWNFNVLSDCRDMLAIAAKMKNAADILAVCELGFIALSNIKDRYLEKQRLGVTGDELHALRALVDVSCDFWKRQSGELFRRANVELDKARGYQRERKAA